MFNTNPWSAFEEMSSEMIIKPFLAFSDFFFFFFLFSSSCFFSACIMNESAASGNGQEFDVFSAMDWKDGIGTLPGSDLKVRFVIFNKKDTNFKCQRSIFHKLVCRYLLL